MVFIQERYLCLLCNNTIPDPKCTFCNKETEVRKIFPTDKDVERYKDVIDIENNIDD